MTKKLIRIPSVLGEEGEIGEFIASHLSKEDVFFQRVPGFPPNVIARKLSSEDAPTILLNGHMDTIRPLSSWRHDPYRPRIKGNMLYGLGASDMKGGLAVLINAFQKTRNDRINLILAATVDEEGICSGAHVFAKENEGDFCVVGEPSKERVILRARGRYVLDIVVQGRAAHGARPDEGTNAIEDVAKVVASLKDVKVRRHRLMGSGSIAPLEIQGGEGSLTIPETCRMVVDRHTVLGETQEMVLKDFKKVTDGLRVPSKIRVSFVKRKTPFLEPFATDGRDQYVRKFIRTFELEYHRQPEIGYAKSVGDYNIFGPLMPTVIFGPLGKGSHTSRERLDVRSLYRCERLLIRFLNSL